MNTFIKLRDVIGITGLSRSSIYNLVSQGTFPKQVKISARAVRWLESDIQDWINQKLEGRV